MARLMAGIDDSGSLKPLKVDNDGSLKVTGVSGDGGGGGDASAANQQIQIDALEAIQQQTTAFDGVDSFLSVAYSALQLFINIGTKNGSAASNDTGDWDLFQLFKRLLSAKLDISLSTLRDSITNAISNQSPLAKFATTLSAPGVYDIPFSGYRYFTVFYTVTNYSSEITLRIEGGVNSQFDNISFTNEDTTINSDGNGSFTAEIGGIETLRVNFVTGVGTIQFDIGIQK